MLWRALCRNIVCLVHLWYWLLVIPFYLDTWKFKLPLTITNLPQLIRLVMNYHMALVKAWLYTLSYEAIVLFMLAKLYMIPRHNVTVINLMLMKRSHNLIISADEKESQFNNIRNPYYSLKGTQCIFHAINTQVDIWQNNDDDCSPLLFIHIPHRTVFPLWLHIQSGHQIISTCNSSMNNDLFVMFYQRRQIHNKLSCISTFNMIYRRI